MSFARELKDFVSGFQAGYKLIPKKSKSELDQEGADKAFKEGAAGAGNHGPAPTSNSETSGVPLSETAPASAPVAGSAGSDTLAGGSGTGVPVGKSLPTFAQSSKFLSGSTADYAQAIKDIESSGGNYDAMGPVIRKKNGSTDQAVGAYQVMKSNIPEWTRTAYGKELTADEFRKNPEAQDKVFAHYFTGAIKRYGTPQDAASVWFSGRPLAQAGGSKDALGTTVPGYVKKFNASLARRGTTGVADTPRALPVDVAGTTPRKPVVPTETAATTPESGGEEEEQAQGVPMAPTMALPDYDPLQAKRLPIEVSGYERNYGVFAAEGGVIPSGVPLDYTDDRNATTYAATRQTEINQEDLVDLDGAATAVDAGLKYIQKSFGFGQPQAGVEEVDPRSQARYAAFAAGEGAADPQTVREVEKTVDPNGTLSQDQRQIAAYNATYQYWMNKGQPEKAQKAAAGMLMATKRAVAMGGSMAMHAYKNDDVQGMADGIVDAKNRIPDGETIRATKVGKEGAEFEIVDNQGNITSRGKASIDDMVHMATGMMNGTAWFEQLGLIKQKRQSARERELEQRQAALDEYNDTDPDKDAFLNSLTPARREAFKKLGPTEQSRMRNDWRQTNAQQRPERERQAAEEFNESLDPDTGDYVTTLTPAQREKFNKLTPSQQSQARTRYATRMKEERRQTEWQYKVDTDLENRDYKRDTDQFKMAQRQGNWETTRSDTMTRFERQLAERERENDDRNRRQEDQQAFTDEQRKQRDTEIDRRILESRAERQRAAKERAAAKGSADPLAPKTAGERNDTREEIAFKSRVGEIADSPEETMDLTQGVPVQGGIRPGDYGSNQTYGPTGQQFDRIEAARAGVTFNKAANDPKGVRQYEQADFDNTETALQTFWDDAKGTPGYKPLAPGDKTVLANLADQIRRSNSTDPKAATMQVLAAINPTKPAPRVLPDGTVQFDRNLSPVKVSEDNLLMLARYRSRSAAGKKDTAAVTSAGNGTGGAQPAVPGSTAPQSGVPIIESPAAQRQRAMDNERARSRNQGFLDAERGRMGESEVVRQRLAEQLGDDYVAMKQQLGREPTVDELRKAINDQQVEQGLTSRRNRARGVQENIRRTLDDRYGTSR